MLKNIPGVLGPELIKVLMEMGHGDEILIADGNFPAASNAIRLIRCDGLNIVDLLEPILIFFPLDTFEKSPVIMMAVEKGDNYKPDSEAISGILKVLNFWIENHFIEEQKSVMQLLRQVKHIVMQILF